MLNGRLEPCGYVDGFTAELGASGSFRPAHISLPVGAAYFSLHAEHGGGSSPYLVCVCVCVCVWGGGGGGVRACVRVCV